MKLKNLTTLLTRALGIPVNQSMLASSLGITRQTISNRIKNDSELTVSELARVEKYFNINITNQVKGLSSGDFLVDYYPEIFASCGSGAIVFSDTKELISLPQKFVSNFSNNKKYSIIHARGDSMSPLIDNEDKLLIEHIFDNQIIDNKIYVFCYKNEIYVKRLAKNLDEVIIKSDNSNYKTRIISGNDLSELKIIGLVVNLIKRV